MKNTIDRACACYFQHFIRANNVLVVNMSYKPRCLRKTLAKTYIRDNHDQQMTV